MRFNKQELITIATQSSTKFEKEGILYVLEKQESFFRKAEVNLERWCRLRGNLLFYFNSKDPWSELSGVIILEQFHIRVENPPSASCLPGGGQFQFHLLFSGGMCQVLGSVSESERSSWIKAIKFASLEGLRAEIKALQQCLERRPPRIRKIDLQTWRLQIGQSLDIMEVPICEISLSCDNLRCGNQGCPPNAFITVDVFMPAERIWLQYGRTERIERSSNPSFLTTVTFRGNDGLSSQSCIRFTIFDVIERVSETGIPIGYACVLLGTIQDPTRVRITLTNASKSTIGFLTINSWTMESQDHCGSTQVTPCQTPRYTGLMSHRRSQSLPPSLGPKIRLPNQIEMKLLYSSPYLQTYRFHSGLGGDIYVHEYMAESRLGLLIPCQLLGIWMQQEKELLQEVVGMGELREPWHTKQVELLDRHLQILRLYSQARETIQSYKGGFFKHSAKKQDQSLEFLPVNLHLQRIWVQNDTLNKSGIHDCITVGAFTAHAHKTKNGGLIKLLNQVKGSPIQSSAQCQTTIKINMANDAIQAIKQLRKEVVEGMRHLLRLAKQKQTIGMLPICDEMINKTRILLSLWDPGLVEEALNFIEEYKSVPEIADEAQISQKQASVLSHYRQITKELHSFNLRSTSMDNFAATPSTSITEDMYLIAESNSNHNISSYMITMSEDLKSPEEDFSINKFTESQDSKNSDIENIEPDENYVEPKINKVFLDTTAMCNSPTANYYKPTDEPEPWDITQLNIEASVMCLVSKVKFLCGRCGSPAVRLRQKSKSISKSVMTQEAHNKMQMGGNKLENSSDVRKAKPGNKFTDGLDLEKIVDWPAELKPSMKKLRLAMDGLLKTARLTHSVFRLQEDARITQKFANVRYRRDVCFSQSLTALVTGLMTKLWSSGTDVSYVTILTTLGPLACFESLLSYYSVQIDMWGDMSVAIEDLKTVTFTIVRSPSPVPSEPQPVPKITGNRSALTVSLPVPDSLYNLIPNKKILSFQVTPVFFNIGINEMATLAENLGATKPQEASNIDNFDRLNEYYLKYRKLNIPEGSYVMNGRCIGGSSKNRSLAELMGSLKTSIYSGKAKNVEILHLASQICRRMRGLRFTSCKSAKDRTGMSVTLEQAQILSDEYHLAEHEFSRALDCMRREGCRRLNALKNINVKKYAFNHMQVWSLPMLYRPPLGTYGSTQT